jgi:histone-lysine N-methyltransferase SETMAR
MSKEIKCTGRYYSNDILSQTAALRDVGNHRKKIVLPDNSGPQVAKCVTEFMDHNSIKRAPHSPYSPDLAPSEFYLFVYVKHQLQGHEFTEQAELVSAISEILNQIPIDTLIDALTIG